MKRLFALVIMLTLTHALWSQGRGDLERVKAFKTGYLTQELDLSSAEAEKFWPVYNSYEKEIFELRIKKRRAERDKMNSMGGPEGMTEEQAQEFLQSLFENESQVLETKKEMYGELGKILSSKKLLKLFKAEADFNKRLLSEFRRRGPNRPGD